MKSLSKKTTILALGLIATAVGVLIWIQFSLAPDPLPEPWDEEYRAPNEFEATDDEPSVDEYACEPEERVYNFPPIQNLSQGWKVYQDTYLGIQFAYPPDVDISIEEVYGTSGPWKDNTSGKCLVSRGVSIGTEGWSGVIIASTWGIYTGREGFSGTDSVKIIMADGKEVTVSIDADCSKEPGWNADCGKHVSFEDKGVDVWAPFFVDTLDSSAVADIPAEEIFKTFGVYEPLE